MKTLLVCYDLKNGNEEQYKKLIETIQLMGTAKHLQYSVWTLQTSKTVYQVRNSLLSIVNPTDSIFVCEISSFSYHNIPMEVVGLISNPLKPIIGLKPLAINKSKSPIGTNINQKLNTRLK